MDRAAAKALAGSIRQSVAHDVVVEEDEDGAFVVRVTRVVDDRPDRFWIRDHDDWTWLRPRIEA